VKTDRVKLQKIIVNMIRSALEMCSESDSINVSSFRSFDDL